MPRIVPIKGKVTTIYLLDDDNNVILFRNLNEPPSDEILEFLEAVVDAMDKECEARLEENHDRLVDDIIEETIRKFAERYK